MTPDEQTAALVGMFCTVGGYLLGKWRSRRLLARAEHLADLADKLEVTSTASLDTARNLYEHAERALAEAETIVKGAPR